VASAEGRTLSRSSIPSEGRSRRTERVGEQIREELARLLRQEVTDPRIGLVTLTRVDVAPDLSNARVFWSALSPQPSAAGEGVEPDAATQDGLDSAAGFLRSRLARALGLRRMPELHFLHDPSLAEGAHTLALLRELRDGGE
jgi:ribosome-binding factor A